MQYTDLATLKAFLSITDNSQDAYLTTLISQAIALVDIDLGDNLEKKTYTRRIDGNGSSRLVMENVLNSVTSVRNVRTDETIDVEYIDGSIIYLEEEAPIGNKNIEVIYERGYTNVPTDFSRFFLEYCRELYKMKNATTSTETVKSKRLGDLSLTFFAPSELKDEQFLVDFDCVMKKYKNFNLY